MHWEIIAIIVGPIFGAVIGAFLIRRFDAPPRVVTFMLNTSAVTISRDEAEPVTFNGHTIIIRNGSRRAATNIRIGHEILPDFSIYPPQQYTVERLPDGGADIVLPTLVPGEFVNVTYLYLDPVKWSQVNTTLKHDKGLIRTQNVLPTPQLPNWLQKLAWVSMFLGLIFFLLILWWCMKFFYDWYTVSGPSG